MVPAAHFATLYAKPAGRPVVDTFVKEFKQNKWIYFPWDIEYQFSTPIKDRPQMELRLTPPESA
jgi:xanthine phosphoribosyltransferase